MFRQGANVKLAAELQVGAAGKIETESRNKTSLRGGGRAKSPGRGGRPAPVAVASPGVHSSQGPASSRSASPAHAQGGASLPTSAAERVRAAKAAYSSMQRRASHIAPAPAPAPEPSKPRTTPLPDVLDLGWPADDASPGRSTMDSALGGGLPPTTPRGSRQTVTFAASFDGGDEMRPEQ